MVMEGGSFQMAYAPGIAKVLVCTVKYRYMFGVT